MALRGLRRSTSLVKRWLWPSPEIAAWRHACALAEVTPRRQHGAIAMNGYRIQYADLLTLCPQWHDIFVAGSLAFNSRTPNPRILDCGANVGLASLYFKKRYPAAQITAYEPDPMLAAFCAANLRQNGAADVRVEASAVWVRNGTATFRADGADSGAIDEGKTGTDGLREVSAIRLRDVIAQEPIDFLKLDIEGAERAVLVDCADALDRVHAIHLDLHEFDPEHRCTPEIFNQLAAAGFVVSVSDVMPLPWRVTASAGSPFPTRALAWAQTVRAWRA